MSILHLILAILGLGFLIFIHELGHFLVARKVGMRVEAFSIGFGKALISWKKNGVEWKISIIPLGGYVKIAGMEKEGKLEPHQIKDGFFGSSPLSRIKVALMGPLTNIIFAFIGFSIIWAAGGRLLSYSEISNKIGFIDAKSEIFKKGIRVGDSISKYDDKEFKNLKDLLYTGLSDKKEINVQGNKIDYFSSSKTPYNLTVNSYKDPSANLSFFARLGLAKTGIEMLASYMIVPEDGKFMKNSPMVNSGLKPNDRILWLNGDLLFSEAQQMQKVNNLDAFLTVMRNGKIFHTKMPRVKLEELKVNKYDKEEINDWKHSLKNKTKLEDLYFIPYYVNENAVVEDRFFYLDKTFEKEIDNKYIRSTYYTTLQRGDKILAVDNIKISNSIDLLSVIQNPHAVFIVQRNYDAGQKDSYKTANANFYKDVDFDKLERLISTIGTSKTVANIDNIALLNTVTPKTVQEIVPNDYKNDPLKEIFPLRVGFKTLDRSVSFNPTPLYMFGSGFSEIFRTMKILAKTMKFKYVSSPIGIVQGMQKSFGLGWKEALFWLSFISLNLGIFNLLPIPILDGGHIVMSLFEMITKKPIKAKVMEKINYPFIILLVVFFIYVAYNDIVRIFNQYFN
jgi:regulator of sigma E protease